MTKIQVIRNSGGQKLKFFFENVKLGKFSTESQKFLGNREDVTGSEMHHCLGGMDAPGGMASFGVVIHKPVVDIVW